MALRVCRKYNSVLYSYIGWLIDELCTPSPPPHPLAHPQTAPIGIGMVGGCKRGCVVRGSGGELVNLPSANTFFSAAMLL